MEQLPLNTIALFPALNDKLIECLKSLSAEDWHRQTVARQWKIKDVVAHLLDGNLRQLSFKRDNWPAIPDEPIHSHGDLVKYLNRLNADWVKAMRRVSPAILIEMLEETNAEVYKLFKALDPFAPSIFPVSWAGEYVSLNWFDIAREYTERWLHQQQVRDALNDDALLSKEFYYPALNVYMYAWPYTCREVSATEGTVLKAIITGSGGGEWCLQKEKDNWKLAEQSGGNTIKAETAIDGKEAWKLFSKSKRKEDIAGSFEIKGDRQLGETVLEIVAVMA